MDRKSSPETFSGGAGTGLDPRNALDILDLRSARESKGPHGIAELAGRADAGADVLHYLATHGAPATRVAVAANPTAPAVTNRLLADDDNEDVRAELAVKIARLMPGLSERESSHIFVLTIEDAGMPGARCRRQGARHPGGPDQDHGLHSQGHRSRPGT